MQQLSFSILKLHLNIDNVISIKYLGNTYEQLTYQTTCLIIILIDSIQ